MIPWTFHCWELELGRAPADPLIYINTFQAVMTVLSVSCPQEAMLRQIHTRHGWEGLWGPDGGQAEHRWTKILGKNGFRWSVMGKGEEGRTHQEFPSSLALLHLLGQPSEPRFFYRERCSSSWKELSIPLTPNSLSFYGHHKCSHLPWFPAPYLAPPFLFLGFLIVFHMVHFRFWQTLCPYLFDFGPPQPEKPSTEVGRALCLFVAVPSPAPTQCLTLSSFQ